MKKIIAPIVAFTTLVAGTAYACEQHLPQPVPIYGTAQLNPTPSYGVAQINHVDSYVDNHVEGVSEEIMDAREADESTVYQRQVSYQCQGGKAVKITYGFNEQKLPTFAEAFIDGKTRFMPINLAHSDVAGTMFGDENNYNLATTPLELSNYHKSEIATIQNGNSQIIFKDCQVKSVKKLN